MEKKLLFSLTKKDFVIEWYNGTGSGGQNRNKVATACRIHHPASGAMGNCQEERTRKPNQERAFNRLVESEIFQKWLKLETARRAGELNDIDQKVDNALKQIRVDIKDDKGRWIEATESDFDISEEV
jgi:protein subunit release factor B